jgi:iron-sulfur cluster repair protein YtfE (RIC family)
MSHQPNILSPEGTPFSGRTVGELVAERPGRSRVFQSFQIDFCCQGRRTLGEACAGKEDDLHRHIHLENSVLFPAAQKMAMAG